MAGGLIGSALKNGASDNVSVVVIKGSPASAAKGCRLTHVLSVIMNDSDKPGRGKGPVVDPDSEQAGDGTAFRKGDATRRAFFGQSAVRRGHRHPPHGSDDKAPPAATAGADATQIRPAPDSTRRPQPELPGQPGCRRRQPGPGVSPAVPKVEEHQVLKGRFTLEKVIGVGGMGVVYKALDRLKVEAHDREPYVAIKVLSEEFKAHPESFIALQRESRKTQRIAHPNVVKVFDFDRDGDIVFMTMEYMEGRPLDDLIRQYSANLLPPDDVWNIPNGLCLALIYAHEENIAFRFQAGQHLYHRFRHAQDLRLRHRARRGQRRPARRQDPRCDGVRRRVAGAWTPAYASLEMLLGQQPDVRDDLYALDVPPTT
ncbi:MAG: protein kinase [Chromatiales bacterium]|nr:protein kinase [Chromatiales bacterium]